MLSRVAHLDKSNFDPTFKVASIPSKKCQLCCAHNCITNFILKTRSVFEQDKKRSISIQDPNQDPIPRNTSSGSDGEQNGKKKTRSVTFSLEKESPPSPTVSETSSARRLTARAARSARRQATTEVDPTGMPMDQNGNTTKKVFKRRMDVKNKRNSSNNVGSSLKKKSGKEEEVVKVKLNTGTLYLYKGLHRRAVFVRRI